MGLGKKIKYKFDNFMSRGAKSMFTALFAITLISLIIGAFLIFLLIHGKDAQKTFWESIWWSIMHITDTGTFTGAEHASTSLVYKLLSVFVTFCGILIFSLLIAFLNTFFQKKIENLQKGRSEVIEKDFTLIIGWNDKIFDIIEEIILANENQKKPAIVILSAHDKVFMDEILAKEIKHRKNTRIITRSGEISSFSELSNIHFNDARSIIVLASSNASASDEEKISSDSKIIKILLAVLYHPERKKEPFNIVTEIYDNKNIEVIKSFGEDNVTIVDTNEIIAKVMTQTSRQSGLPTVYEELLSFNGCEIYLNEYPETFGKTFGQIYNKFPTGYPIGIIDNKGKVTINPQPEIVINKKDKLVVISEDDDTCKYSDNLSFKNISGNPSQLTGEITSEKVLILGYNERVINIINEFEEYTAQGSQATIVYNFSNNEKQDLTNNIKNISKIACRLVEKDYTNREIIYSLNPFDFDIIFVMSRDMNTSTMEKSDADTIYTLLVLREIQRKQKPNKNTRIVSEILDMKNKDLIESASVNDFIISYKMVSMILAQISEQKDMSKIYEDIFSEEGSEIYLKSASKYFDNLPLEVDFYQIMDRVIKRKELAFGYKNNEFKNDKSKNYGVKLNPVKKEKILLKPEDKIIVVAENER